MKPVGAKSYPTNGLFHPCGDRGFKMTSWLENQIWSDLVFVECNPAALGLPPHLVPELLTKELPKFLFSQRKVIPIETPPMKPALYVFPPTPLEPLKFLANL